MKWDKLSLLEKSRYTNLGIQNGITGLDGIQQFYYQNQNTNKFGLGGDKKREEESWLDKVGSAINIAGKVARAVTQPLIYAVTDILPVYIKGKYEEEDRKKALEKSVGSVIKKGDKYYRVDANLNEHEVTLGDDGHYHWVRDGVKYRTRTGQHKELDDNFEAINQAVKIGREQQSERLDKMKHLSKEDLADKQRELSDEGYYTQVLKSKSKKEIKRIQKRLGVKADGIVGPITEKAFNKSQIDGVWGRNTKKAFDIKYNTNNSSKVKEDLEGCAQYITALYEAENGLTSKRYGVIGDAWTMPQNIVNKGGTMKYNLYDDPRFKEVSTPAQLKQMTIATAKDHPLDYKNIKVGDVVGIYMPSSDMHKVALANGTTKNTHIGYVTGIDKDGMPLISHNIHTSYRTDRADKLTGSKRGTPFITTLTTPKSSVVGVSELEFPSRESRFKVEGGIGKDFQQVMNGMEGASDIFQRMFQNINVEDAMRSAIAVQQRETNMGKNRTSDQIEKSLLARGKNEIRNLVRQIKGESSESKSSNQMKMKFTSLEPYERKMLGIKSPKDLEDPQKAGVAALYVMCKNMDYFTRLKEQYPDLGLTDEDVESLTMLSYNQGMSKLANIGFRTDSGVAAPAELAYIRKTAAPNAKIYDYTSTNYRHAGTVGRVLYDMFGDPHTPYISSAKKAKSKIKKK